MEQIASLVEELSAEIRRQWYQKNPQQQQPKGSFKESVLGFIHAVDWTACMLLIYCYCHQCGSRVHSKEPWLISLLVCHVVLFFIAIRTRKNNNLQMALFFSALFGVYMAERLNRLLAHKWTSFAHQPYFDHHGIFMSTVWSGPLLCVSCLILVNGLVSLSTLMIKWKRAELRHRARLASAKENKVE